jgi:hypothetical protein
MIRSQLVTRVRSLTRDFSGTTFRIEDVQEFLNEGIDRLAQLFPVFENMVYLENDSDEPVLLPKAFHSVLALFATSRLFAQDERAYQATTYMNEFELKMDELRGGIDDGRIVIKDANGVTLSNLNDSFYVEDNYFTKYTGTSDFDYPEDEDLPEENGDEIIITLDGGEV